MSHQVKKFMRQEHREIQEAWEQLGETALVALDLERDERYQLWFGWEDKMIPDSFMPLTTPPATLEDWLLHSLTNFAWRKYASRPPSPAAHSA